VSGSTHTSRQLYYAGCILLACVAAVLTAIPVFGQTATATLVGAGDIANCNHGNDEKTAKLLANIPGTVYTLGDNTYPKGRRVEFANCYDNYLLSNGSTYNPSRRAWWGKYKRRTMPTLGNHEYLNFEEVGDAPPSKPYFDYFRAVNGFKEPRAPVPNSADNPGLTYGKGYYSYDRGGWHIVALNSNCDKVGGCGRYSPQGRWLRNDLADNPSRCTLAYWHHPLYASGTGSDTPAVKPFWSMLHDRDADVILAGHAHRYERFRPITPNGTPSPNGIRQFIVGTGGEPGGVQYGPNDPNLQVKKTDTPGVLRLNLRAGSYTWKFVPIAGKTFSDSGSDRCH
jgi:acid phosphatase type 7